MKMIKDNRINEAAEMMTEMLQTAAPEITEREAKIWFDKECYSTRKSMIQALHKARQSPRIDHLEEYAEKKKKI